MAPAAETGIDVRIGPATEALLTTVADTGREWPDFTAVIEALAPSRAQVPAGAVFPASTGAVTESPGSSWRPVRSPTRATTAATAMTPAMA